MSLFKKLSNIRSKESALTKGDYIPLVSSSENVFAFIRSTRTDTFIIVLNFIASQQKISINYPCNKAEIILSTKLNRSGKISLDELKLQPNEGLIIK